MLMDVIGTDLSPTQVTTAPPNIRFEVDDASLEWTYPESSFDFVHVRGLTGCIRDWPYLYQQAYRYLHLLLFSPSRLSSAGVLFP